jgi:hypothetical protein
MSKRFTYYGSFASVVATWFSDDFGMPDAAYSLRKLTPSATNCIRVRRSSDNTEQDIGFVANVPNSPIDTAALLAFVGAGDGFVTTAYNQNTSGTNFTTTTSTQQLKIVNAGTVVLDGGLASLNFSSNLSRIFNNSIANKTVITAFRVHNTSSAQYLTWSAATSGSGYNYVATLSGTATVIFNTYGSPQLFTNGTAPSPLTNRGHVYTAQNGRKIITEIGSTTNWNTFQIGGYTSFSFVGDIPELIIYFSDQLSQRTAIETNINTYYNVF